MVPRHLIFGSHFIIFHYPDQIHLRISVRVSIIVIRCLKNISQKSHDHENTKAYIEKSGDQLMR